jgi:predicted tellurium resistance membrane protein TerC
MLELVTDPNAWVALLTLSALEIVLGIDNVIFLSIVSDRLPKHQQKLARRIGLGLALFARIALLGGLTFLIGLTAPLFTALSYEISWRDLILIGGGAFLLVKATTEMHHILEGHDDLTGTGKAGATAALSMVIAQIVMLDLVFSLDSILTAIGMVEEIAIMVAAIVFAIFVMLLAAEPLSAFINKHPTVKMLALAFLLLVGVALVADGLDFHIPRGYLYAAIAFSAGVEAMNLWAARRRNHRDTRKEP